MRTKQLDLLGLSVDMEEFLFILLVQNTYYAEFTFELQEVFFVRVPKLEIGYESLKRIEEIYQAKPSDIHCSEKVSVSACVSINKLTDYRILMARRSCVRGTQLPPPCSAAEDACCSGIPAT